MIHPPQSRWIRNNTEVIVVEYKKNLKQEYLKQSVMTASPAELVVMLFDACNKNLKLAEYALEDRPDYLKANQHLLKAQKIILELIATLDMSFELSKQLLPIYDYLLRSIRTMNATKNLSELPAVLNIIATQRETWEQVAKHINSSSSKEACV